ncbi:hypothetical protein AB9K26_07375 [Psychroserpens sp. XS_ASV72]|uniref:hypothetical protein n=1 Tax=Psychroserpens sp. XS_ASV72 TaxID=3241293 RepID=UPI0035176207
MKLKLIVLLIVFCFSRPIQAQDFKVSDIVTFKVPVAVGNVEVASFAKNDTNSLYLEPNIKFYIIDFNDKKDSVKLRAVDFKSIRKDKKEKLKQSKGTLKSELYENKVYQISYKDLVSYGKIFVPKDKISVGLLTLPFKARPQEEFAFDTEFNLNSTLNILFSGQKNVSWYYQFGAGVGSVNLNTSNARGLSDTEAQDVSILTFFNGVMIEYKKIQIGLYAGVDHINNQKNYDWNSNGNIWLGFGIGYNLFKLSSPDAENSDD